MNVVYGGKNNSRKKHTRINQNHPWLVWYFSSTVNCQHGYNKREQLNCKLLWPVQLLPLVCDLCIQAFPAMICVTLDAPEIVTETWSKYLTELLKPQICYLDEN